jgi:predicted ATP-grasp superfamily ATP-dependent carboligase
MGAVFISDGLQSRFVGATQQLTARPTGERLFVYGGSLGPLKLGGERLEAVTTIGAMLTAKFGLRGLFGVDFIENCDLMPFNRDYSLWTLEINPRYTAGMEILERAFGYSLIADHVRACNGHLRDEYPTSTDAWHGKQIVYAEKDCRIDQMLSDRLMSEAGNGDRQSLADIPQPGTFVAAGAPLVTVFAVAGRRDGIAKLLEEGAARIAGAVASAVR